MMRDGWPATHLRVEVRDDGTLEVWGGSCGRGVRVLAVRAGDGAAFAEKLARAAKTSRPQHNPTTERTLP